MHLESTIFPILSGRLGGLIVSALDSGSNSPGASPGQGTALCSWARHFTLTLTLFTQVYKWVPVNLILTGEKGGGNPTLD